MECYRILIFLKCPFEKLYKYKRLILGLVLNRRNPKLPFLGIVKTRPKLKP